MSLNSSPALVGVLSLAQTSNAQFATSVVSYNSGIGFQPGYTSAQQRPGEPSRITPGLPAARWIRSTPLISVHRSFHRGGRFTHRAIRHANPEQPRPRIWPDFNIFGNAGFIVTNSFDDNYNVIGIPRTDGSLFGADATATRVSVSSDGVNFFTLNPALAPTVDALFPTDGLGDFGLSVNPTLTAANSPDLIWPASALGLTTPGGGIGFDIAWAQDGLGQSIVLSSIEFVRIEVLGGNAEIDGLVAVPEPTMLAHVPRRCCPPHRTPQASLIRVATDCHNSACRRRTTLPSVVRCGGAANDCRLCTTAAYKGPQLVRGGDHSRRITRPHPDGSPQ